MVFELSGAAFFFREKPVLALIALSGGKEDWYASSLAKETDCTFPHMIKVLAEFERLGLVSFKDNGRKKLVFLTPKGRQASVGFMELAKAVK